MQCDFRETTYCLAFEVNRFLETLVEQRGGAAGDDPEGDG
jgi:hypothetical protein